jgi:hypothetical protein
MQDSPSGVPGDESRGGVDASSRVVVDRSFHGRTRSIPHPFSVITTPVQVFVSDGGAYRVAFGVATSVTFELWTDVRGMDVMIDALQAAKARAEISGIGEYVPAHSWLEEAPF